MPISHWAVIKIINQIESGNFNVV